MPDLSPERWRRINELFHDALAREPGAREGFVRDAAGGDDDLAREVLSLLAIHPSSGYLEQPAWALAADLLEDEDEPLRPGEAVGKYRVLGEIARGGMGVVYRASDDVLGRQVALKALPPEYANDPGRRDRLAREAKLAAQLSHRAVATVYELVESGGRLYIASELVAGITLRRELADGPLPPSHLLSTLIEIASALAAAHARGIVHRDLKPENIVRREDGQIKVLDFGLARATARADAAAPTHLTEAGLIAGTPGYIAPETLSRQPVDARSDIFAFGILGWELATGRHPLGADPHAQMARLREIAGGAEPPLDEALPITGLEAILRRCAAGAPDARYPSAESLLDDLRSLQRYASHPGARPARPGLWWWQFHQASMAVVVGSTPIWGWIARRWIAGPRGIWVFLVILGLATAAVTLRLNLLFTSRVHPAIFPDHHRRLSRWVGWLEGTLCLILIGSAAATGMGSAALETHEAMAAVFLTLAVVIAASLLVIEPATARGAGLKSP